MGTPILEENGPEDFKGIDIMRAVRSFDPAVRGARLDGRSKRLEGAYERSGRGPRRGF